MIINREWAMPNKWTFQIQPIKKLLNKYVGDGKGWIDPFAGENSPAEITNDLNQDRPTKYHLDALEFSKNIPGPIDGVLFDPPYSYTQVKECYESIGLKVFQEDTSPLFYSRIIKELYTKITPGGYTISFGWNSQGFGKTNGFKIIEILLVCHGGHHNDTIVTVEKKINNNLDAYV